MDFDSDGTPDILSGSWPGELYLFRGLGKGRFAAGQVIRDRVGKAIKAGSASTVFASDWSGNGRLDLLVGSIEGFVYLVQNEGRDGKHAFAAPRRLSAGGKPVQVGEGDSHPTAADWDGDGLPDLVTGAGDGSVVWFRNTGSRSAPQLASAQTLLPAASDSHSVISARTKDAPKEAVQEGQDRRGRRAKVCVTDWNDDGRSDLLVGDFTMREGRAPEQMADAAAREAAEKDLNRSFQRLTPYFSQVRKLGQPPARGAGRALWMKRSQALQTRYRKDLDDMRSAQVKLMGTRPPYTLEGFVWLVTRPTAVATGR